MNAAAASPSPTPDEQLYANAITTMRDLPEPPYLTFVTNVTVQGDASTELRSRKGIAILRVWLPPKGRGQRSASWATSYRGSDDLGSVATPPQGHLVARSPVFNPTWTGAYDWLRFGIDGRPSVPSSSPQPSAEPHEHLKTIGMVRALGPSSYRITAANAASCPNGQPGRHFQLTPRNGDIWGHPLTDVTVQLASSRFCSMRFHVPVTGFSGNSFAELHLGTVNGFWMTTSADFDLHAPGLRGLIAGWHISYDDMRFPDRLDDAMFSLPDPS